MSKKNYKKTNEPSLAPGIDDQEELEQRAAETDIENGEYTRVVTLSYDEVDPS